jgi:uncharacterized tellurite resistance protein B-like protein
MSIKEEDLVAALSDLELVVEDTNKFKLKLGIGEDAYASLKLTKTLQTIWDMKGAAGAGATAAASPVIASTFFGGTGFLSFMGIGVAATPVGWIIGAAVVSGGAYYGAMRMVSNYSSSRVETIPKFINTPIDLLGATLFDMMAGMALKVADFAGEIDNAERSSVIDYFVEEWGVSREYAVRALPLVEASISGKSLKNMAKSLADFQLDNPDCNPSVMRGDIMKLLEEISYADGSLDEREELAIETVERQLSEHLSVQSQIIRNTSKYAGAASGLAQNAAQSAGAYAQSTFGGATKLAGRLFNKKK